MPSFPAYRGKFKDSLIIHKYILFTKMMNIVLQYKDREHMNFFSVTIFLLLLEIASTLLLYCDSRRILMNK